MNAALPLKYEGNGLFRCLRPKQITCRPGEVRAWQEVEYRSDATHRHFFAVVHEAWKNLPEDMAGDFPSPDHLRKWALIKAGFCTATKVVCANNDEALTMAVLAKRLDSYAVVLVDGRVCTTWTADSQRRDKMGRKAFQEAKDKAMHIISNLIGTDATTLSQEARNAQD